MKKLVTLIFFLSFSMLLHAQITSAQAGDWSNTATWTGGVVPTSTDNVSIGHAVNIDNGAAACNDLVFSAGSINFTTATSILSVYGNATFGSNKTNISGWTSGAKLVFAGTATQTWTTGTTSNFDIVEINKPSGTVTQATGAIVRIGTSFTVTGGGTFTLPGGNDIEGVQFADGATATTPTITVGVGSTFNCDVATTAVIRSGTSGTATIGAVTVYGTMNLGTTSGNGFRFGAVTVGNGTDAATLTMTTNMGASAAYTFTGLTVNANATFYMNSTSIAASTITGDILGSGTVVYGVGASTNHPSLDRNFGGNLTMGAATRSWVTTTPRTVSGNLIINGSGTHTGTFGSGTLTVNGNMTITGTSRLTWSGNIVCNGDVTVSSTNSTVALYPSSAAATLSGTTGKTFSLLTGSILRIAATGATPISTQHGGFSTFDCQSGTTIEYYKTATTSITVQDQYNGSNITYSALKVSHNNTSGSATMTVTINNPSIATSLVLAQQSALASNTHTMSVTFANSSSLTIPTLTLSTTSAAGTLAQNITFGAQPVVVTGNVSITSAAGTATATSCVVSIGAGGLTINGNLTLGSTGVTTPFNTPYIVLNDPNATLTVGGSTTLRSLEQSNGNIKFTSSTQTVTFNGAVTTANGNVNSETFNFNGFSPTVNFNGNFTDGAAGTTFYVTGTEVPVINFNNGTSGTPLTTSAAGLRGAITVNGYRQCTGTNFRTTNATAAAYSFTVNGVLDLGANGSTATNTGGGTNTINGSGTIKLTGDYATKITGYSSNNFQGNGTLEFNGSTAQNIPAGTYYGITVNNSAGVNLTGNVVISGALALNAGKLTTSSNTLSITNSSSSAIVGGSSSSYIVGSLTRAHGTSSGNYVLPIGTATDYRGATVNFTSDPASATDLTASFTASDPQDQGLPEGITSYWNGGYWTIASSGTPGAEYSVSLNAANVTGLGADSRILRRANSSSAWTVAGNYSDLTSNVLTHTNVTGFSEFAIGGTNTALPVELAAFSADVKNGSAVLNWKTATEVNAFAFVVERATVTSTDLQWTEIGRVMAAGNANSSRDYSYRDANTLPGKMAYRLRMVDNDGTYKYSKTVEVDVTVPKEFTVSQNYPNPFNPATRIDFSLPQDAQVQLEIFAISGEKVATVTNGNFAAGTHAVTVNMQSLGLGSGVYLYRVQAVSVSGERFVQTKKMVMLK